MTAFSGRKLDQEGYLNNLILKDIFQFFFIFKTQIFLCS